MGIKFYCPNGHKMHVKSFLAGKRGLCPKCGVRVEIPVASVTGPAPPVRAPDDLAEGSVLLSAAGAEDLGTAKTLLPEPESAIGLAPDEAAAEALLKDTVGEEVAPVSQEISGEAEVGGSSAGMIEIEGDLPALASDPLQIPQGEVWYVHLPNGQQLGPVASDTLREWLDEGRVGTDALVWRSGWEQWMAIRDAFATNRRWAAQGAGLPSNESPMEALEKPIVAGPVADYRPHRTKSRFSLTASLCLLALVLLLFLILLFVFSKRTRSAAHSAGDRRAVLATSDRKTIASFS